MSRDEIPKRAASAPSASSVPMSRFSISMYVCSPAPLGSYSGSSSTTKSSSRCLIANGTAGTQRVR
jgi:hypothetical protein